MAFVTFLSLSAVVQETSWELECQLLSLSCSAMGHCPGLEEMTVFCHQHKLLGSEMPVPPQSSTFLLPASVF